MCGCEIIIMRHFFMLFFLFSLLIFSHFPSNHFFFPQHYSDIGTGENTHTSWGVELSSNMSTHATNGVAAW